MDHRLLHCQGPEQAHRIADGAAVPVGEPLQTPAHGECLTGDQQVLGGVRNDGAPDHIPSPRAQGTHSISVGNRVVRTKLFREAGEVMIIGHDGCGVSQLQRKVEMQTGLRAGHGGQRDRHWARRVDVQGQQA